MVRAKEIYDMNGQKSWRVENLLPRLLPLAVWSQPLRLALALALFSQVFSDPRCIGSNVFGGPTRLRLHREWAFDDSVFDAVYSVPSLVMTWELCTRRAGKLYTARALLYRRLR